jgi:hypothetical protein
MKNCYKNYWVDQGFYSESWKWDYWSIIKSIKVIYFCGWWSYYAGFSGAFSWSIFCLIFL